MWSACQCVSAATAGDALALETLLALTRGVRQFRGVSSLTTWLFSVARSFCIKHRRKAKSALLPTSSRVTSSDSTTDESIAKTCSLSVGIKTSADIEAQAIQKQIELTISRAFDSLDSAHREVLWMRDVEGHAAAEVATMLQASAEAVKSRLHRARRSLRESAAPLFEASEH
jgi:RNA polymerase sigma-70 factor, ECF subfamily